MLSRKKRSDGERLYLVVQHLARRLRDIDQAAGLTSARFAVLVDLAFHGASNVSDLAGLERVSRPAMTRLVHDMERSGLVSRRQDSKDLRGTVVTLTKKGRNAVARVRERKIDLLKREIAALDQQTRSALKVAIEVLERREEISRTAPRVKRKSAAR